jgi:hypothetical protein
MRLTYLLRGGGDPDSMAADARAALREHADAARSNHWPDYAGLFNVLEGCCRATGNRDGVQQVIVERLAYDPSSSVAVEKFIQHFQRANTAVVNRVLQQYYERGGTRTLAIGLFECRQAVRQGMKEYEIGLQLMRRYPEMSAQNLRQLLDAMRGFLDSDKPQQVRSLHRELAAMAAKQPVDKTGAEKIALLINEKRKLELVYPNLASD